MTAIAKLRALAEGATAPDWLSRPPWNHQLTPQVVLALLDVVEAARPTRDYVLMYTTHAADVDHANRVLNELDTALAALESALGGKEGKRDG